MSHITIYGGSDDCIEVDGDIREEWNGEKGVLAFSDGTVLSISYEERNEDGEWVVRRLAEGSAHYEHREPRRSEGEYSDVVALDGDIRWCVFAGETEDGPSAFVIPLRGAR